MKTRTYVYLNRIVLSMGATLLYLMPFVSEPKPGYPTWPLDLVRLITFFVIGFRWAQLPRI